MLIEITGKKWITIVKVNLLEESHRNVMKSVDVVTCMKYIHFMVSASPPPPCPRPILGEAGKGGDLEILG